MKTLYSTEMSFFSNTVKYLLTAIFFIIALAMIILYFVKIDGIQKPPVAAVIIVVIVCIILMAVALFLKTSVSIDAKEITIKNPTSKIIKRKEVENVVVIDADKSKYGGYGHRKVGGELVFVTDDSTKAVRIVANDGTKLVICSNEADRIVRALKS